MKLKPGKITHWYYEIIQPDGSTVTKVTMAEIKGVPDKRRLSDSHPNLAIIVPGLTATGVYVGPIVSGFRR